MGGGGNTAPSTPFVDDFGLTMDSEINVAYSGTFGDLHAGGDADMFGLDSFIGDDFELMGSSTNSFSAVNGRAAPGTVSPKDLFADSVPPSTTFTNLTTPGSTFLDTPDDYQTSPNFVDGMGNDKAWFSLFPEEDNIAVAPTMERTSSNTILVHPGGESNITRKRNSTVPSPTPFSPAPRMSDVAGVAARKRDKPLPPILVDEHDTVALKRARNTAAARKSRAKKVQERDELETTIAQLEEQVRFWKKKAMDLGADDADE